MIEIRKETNSDHASVRQLLIDAFGREDEANLVERLRETEDYVHDLAFVATENDVIVGYILYTLISIEGTQSNESLALAPMAVSPALQKTGIGSRLINHSLQWAKNLGHESVVVLGHKDYYPKFGFKQASRWEIRCPFEVPDDVWMAKELTRGALKNSDGLVCYNRAFYE